MLDSYSQPRSLMDVVTHFWGVISTTALFDVAKPLLLDYTSYKFGLTHRHFKILMDGVE